MGSPAEQLVPFSTTTVGNTLHWVSGECITVTYGAAASAWLPYINAAAAAWTAVSCSAICLSSDAAPSEARIDPKRAERRIQVREGTPDSSGLSAATDVLFEESTGRILGVEITVETIEAGREVTSFLQLFGYALGLDAAAPDVDSIMWDADTISAADETALCTLYGGSSYCGE
jgi:hypothetical protein